MSTDPNRLERRGAQRFEVHLPLVIQFEGRTVPGFTQALSGRGIFFYAEASFPEGMVVDLTFMMPCEITLAESMPVRCRGRVLRSSASSSGYSQDAHASNSQRSGIAVQFDSYEYLPAGESIGPFVRVSAPSGGGVSSVLP